MTKIISVLDLIYTSHYEAYFLSSKEDISEGSLVIAQGDNKIELWFTVVGRIPNLPLKKGYHFLILKNTALPQEPDTSN